MEISASTIYWIFLADNVIGVAVGATVLAALFLVVFLAFWAANDFDFFDDKGKKRAVRTVKGAVAVFAVSLCVAVVTPSTKALIAMVVIPKISQSDAAQEVPKEILMWIRGQLKGDSRD